MKVCITNKYKTWDNAKTGKGFFVQRLIPALENLGCEITTDPKKKVDITLGIGKFVFKPIGKAVLRIGDVHKEKDYKELNAPKKDSLKIADGVIYQSGYSMKMSRAFLGNPDCPEVVIYNGADPKEFDVEPYRSIFSINFLASAREWNAQKRLKGIKNAFLESNISSSCLFICGDTGQKISAAYDPYNHTEIRFLGIVDQKTLASLYKTCNAFLDATWLTACPNNVVEALVAGCPVISQNDSGTAEIGFSNRDCEGKYYHIKDKEWDMKKPVDLKKRIGIDIDSFVYAIKEVLRKPKPVFTYKNLHIDYIARQYVGVFEKVLCQTLK